MTEPNDWALNLAREHHCRYCDREDIAGLKCALDIEDAAEAFRQAHREGYEAALREVRWKIGNDTVDMGAPMTYVRALNQWIAAKLKEAP